MNYPSFESLHSFHGMLLDFDLGEFGHLNSRFLLLILFSFGDSFELSEFQSGLIR